MIYYLHQAHNMSKETLTATLIPNSWYTSMLGKRGSIDTVIAYLKEKKVTIAVISIDCDVLTACLSRSFNSRLAFLRIDPRFSTTH